MRFIKMKTLYQLAALIAMVTSSAPLLATETVYLYSYHNHVPFVTGEQQGKTYELAKYLNSQQNQFDFEVKILPRSRLNQRIGGWINGKCPAAECVDNWMVAWVNPKWGFIKGPEDNYLWHRLFDDSNSIISLSAKPFDYETPKSLDGKIILGMRGHRYVGIDERVNNGTITRIDGNRERDNLKKLLAGRADATLLPTSTMDYFLNQDAMLKQHTNAFHISDKKHQIFTRFLMLPGTRRDLQELIQQAQLASWLKL
jgi:polar amino acid transport system substrate-binding protein